LFSTIGLTLVSHAFRSAPASLIAPLEYTGLLWAAAIGWLFWREIPDTSFIFGAVLIVASGMGIATIAARPKQKE
jgi:drug/metabolite transporter (DMT)-like permease